jgi:predicted O-methyltransferase YrrM
LKCGVQISKVENGVMRDLENLNLQDKLDYLKAKKLKNMQKWELKEAHESTWDTDGLADLSFKVLSESHGPNWSRYLVDLESTAMEPVRKAPAKLRFSPKLPTAPKGSSDKIWDRIDLMYNSVLKDMFVSHQVVFPDGTRDKFHSGISPREGFHLYDVVRQNKFSKTMEVGCAFGTSALYICQAMHDWQKDSCASGLASEVIPQHVSIDPNQSTQWKSVGVLNVERAGLKQYHTLIEDVSYLALPRILSDIRRDPNPKYFDLIFVDGMHLFDYTILDVFYTMHLLKLGGVLVLDDIKHEGVYAAYRFIVSNLEGCLKLCHPSPCERTAATFVKTAQDSRPWDFHRKF